MAQGTVTNIHRLLYHAIMDWNQYDTEAAVTAVRMADAECRAKQKDIFLLRDLTTSEKDAGEDVLEVMRYLGEAEDVATGHD